MIKLKKIAVIGAGVMGAGIAQRAAQHGITVALVDLSDDLVNRGLGEILTTLTQAAEKKILTPEEIENTYFRIHGTTSLDAARDCNLVIEAVFEYDKTKKELFAKLDKVCPPDTIFTTNTSTLSVTELATASHRPERFGGMHFFYHAAKNHLVEVVPGAETSPETVNYLVEAAKLMGQTPLVVKDSPGFAINRFFVPLMNECVRLFEEGIANIPTTDMAVREAFGSPTGPFQLMNLNGVAMSCDAAASLCRRLSPFYLPAKTLERQAKKNAPWTLGGEIVASQFDAVRDRIFGVVFGLAALVVQEGVATREDVETGALKGLRWARGPFELMETVGIDMVRELVKGVARRYNDFPLPEIFH